MIYKIRIISQPGYFVKGTPTYCSSDKSGRVFQTIGRLRAFLTARLSHRANNPISDWEVVSYEMTELKVQPISEVISPAQLVKLLQR